MTGYAVTSLERPEEIYRAGLNTTRLLLALGDLVIGWLLARQAEVALAALDGGQESPLAGRDRAFYQGKLATARFFAQTVLPRLAVERQLAQETTLDLMELPEAAF
jgi:Acetyl-CoA dehydrogenase C-terminal like